MGGLVVLVGMAYILVVIWLGGIKPVRDWMDYAS
jgi:hypothetical protein